MPVPHDDGEDDDHEYDGQDGIVVSERRFRLEYPHVAIRDMTRRRRLEIRRWCLWPVGQRAYITLHGTFDSNRLMEFRLLSLGRSHHPRGFGRLSG